VLQCARRREIVAQSVACLEFSLLAQHVHDLAQLFHKLYHGHPVVAEEDAGLRRLRRAVFTVFVDEIEVLLEELLASRSPRKCRSMKDETRRARYARIRDQIAELIAKTDDAVAHRATAAAVLHHKLPGFRGPASTC